MAQGDFTLRFQAGLGRSRRSDWRSVIRQVVALFRAGNVGLRCANPTYGPARSSLVTAAWIPAFAGMTVMAFGATPCQVIPVIPAAKRESTFCCESTLEGVLLGARASRPHGQWRASGPLRAGRPRSQENPLRNGESFHATGWSFRPCTFGQPESRSASYALAFRSRSPAHRGRQGLRRASTGAEPRVPA